MDPFSFSLVTRNLPSPNSQYIPLLCCMLCKVIPLLCYNSLNHQKSFKGVLPLASARYSRDSPQASVLHIGHFHLWSSEDSHSHLHLQHFTLSTECCVYVCFLFILYKYCIYSLLLYYYYTLYSQLYFFQLCFHTSIL